MDSLKVCVCFMLTCHAKTCYSFSWPSSLEAVFALRDGNDLCHDNSNNANCTPPRQCGRSKQHCSRVEHRISNHCWGYGKNECYWIKYCFLEYSNEMPILIGILQKKTILWVISRNKQNSGWWVNFLNLEKFTLSQKEEVLICFWVERLCSPIFS